MVVVVVIVIIVVAFTVYIRRPPLPPPPRRQHLFFGSCCCDIHSCECVFRFRSYFLPYCCFFTLFCFVLFLLLYFNIFLHSPFSVVYTVLLGECERWKADGWRWWMWQRYGWGWGKQLVAHSFLNEGERANIYCARANASASVSSQPLLHTFLLYIKHQFSLLLTYYFISFVSPSISRLSILFYSFVSCSLAWFFVPFIGHIYIILLKCVYASARINFYVYFLCFLSLFSLDDSHLLRRRPSP